MNQFGARLGAQLEFLIAEMVMSDPMKRPSFENVVNRIECISAFISTNLDLSKRPNISNKELNLIFQKNQLLKPSSITLGQFKKITDEGVTIMVNSANVSKLTSLHLFKTNIADQSMTAFATSDDCTMLHHLNISGSYRFKVKRESCGYRFS